MAHFLLDHFDFFDFLDFLDFLDEDAAGQVRGKAYPGSLEADDQATFVANHTQHAALADSEVAQPSHGRIVEGEEGNQEIATERSGGEGDGERSGAPVRAGHRLSPSRMNAGRY